MKKKLPALILIIFLVGSIVIFSGCDSINVDGSSSGSQPQEEEYTVGFEVMDSETGEGLEQVSIEVFDLQYEDKVFEAGSDEGSYFLTLTEPESEDLELTVKRFHYEENELSIILEENSFTLDDPVELESTDEEGDEDEETETLDIEWVDVEEGESPEPEVIDLSYDLEVSKYPVTNNQFVEFLNNEGSVEVKELSDGKAAVYSDGEENVKLLDLNQDYTQIGHNGEEFYLRGWTDPDGESIDVSNYPVIEVTWYGAAAFTNWLSEAEGHEKVYDIADSDLEYARGDVDGYRLSSSEEWKYIAGGGDEGDETTYSGEGDLDDLAWFEGNSNAAGNTNLSEGHGTMPVGLKESNELGIYDMSGNVREWTDTRPDPEEEEIYYMNGSWGAADKSFFEVDHSFADHPEETLRDHIGTFRHIGFRPVRTNSD